MTEKDDIRETIGIEGISDDNIDVQDEMVYVYTNGCLTGSKVEAIDQSGYSLIGVRPADDRDPTSMPESKICIALEVGL